MGCAGWRETISAGGDGELSVDDLAALEAHLAACASCRHLSTTVTSLRRRTLVGPAEPARDLVASVLEAREQEVVGVRTLRRRVSFGLGAVAAVLVAVLVGSALAGGSRPGPVEQIAAPSGAVVTIEGTAFSDPSLTVDTGATVEWLNRSGTRHHIVREVGASTVAADLAPGQTESVTFGEPGSYPYRCTRHDGMAGSIEVRS